MKGEPRSSEHQTRCSWLSERCEFNATPKDPPHWLAWAPPGCSTPSWSISRAISGTLRNLQSWVGDQEVGPLEESPRPREIVWPNRPTRGEGHPLHHPPPESTQIWTPPVSLHPCLSRKLCPVVKWIRWPRSYLLSHLTWGIKLPLIKGNQALVCWQVDKPAHLACHLSFPHCLTKHLRDCLLSRAEKARTCDQSLPIPPPPQITSQYLPSIVLLLESIPTILWPVFPAKLFMAERRKAQWYESKNFTISFMFMTWLADLVFIAQRKFVTVIMIFSHIFQW